LKILRNEDIGKEASKIVLEKGGTLSTSLLFTAIEVLINSEDNYKNIAEEFVISYIYNNMRQTNSFLRLYYDLLYLPLMNIPEHRNRVLNIITPYNPYLPRSKKYNVSQVLKCYSDFPDIKWFKDEIVNLRKNILESWLEDVKYQYENKPADLIFDHIELAFSMTDLPIKAAKEMVDFGNRNSMFQQCKLYKMASDIITYDNLWFR
jgi:hypothetical protein